MPNISHKIDQVSYLAILCETTSDFRSQRGTEHSVSDKAVRPWNYDDFLLRVRCVFRVKNWHWALTTEIDHINQPHGSQSPPQSLLYSVRVGVGLIPPATNYSARSKITVCTSSASSLTTFRSAAILPFATSYRIPMEQTCYNSYQRLTRVSALGTITPARNPSRSSQLDLPSKSFKNSTNASRTFSPSSIPTLCVPAALQRSSKQL